MEQDTIIELHNFNGYYYQRWNVEHVWNQYYKIISTHSDKALTAPTGANNDVVTQTDYTGELTQRWKFIEQSDGTYKISPESNSNYFMAAGDISSTADQDLEIRTAQSDGGDKWELYEIYDNVHLEAQQQSLWCWAASARMLSFKYIDPSISQASAAVYIKTGIVDPFPSATEISAANKTGTLGEVAETIQYLLGMSIGAIFYQENVIYTESTLRSVLDQGPICFGRIWFDGLGNQRGGHIMVICGYRWDAIHNMYLYDILDPGPVNVGSQYSRSYDWLCDGQNGVNGVDTLDYGKWNGVATYRLGPYDNTVAWIGP